MRAAIALAAALLASTTTNAQQLAGFAETVVVTASGEEQSLEEVDAAATVISAEQLERRGAPGIAESLREVPGAVLLRSGLEGGVASLFVRGAGSNQTLVLFDGVRLNSPFFGGYDWSVPLVAGMARLEVVRGPFSALWGADALGGVVNLIPARAGANQVRLLAEAGGDAWRRAESAAAISIGGFDLALSAATRSGSGTLVNDDYSSRALLTNATWSPSERARLGLLVRSSRSRSEIPFVGAISTPARVTQAEEDLVAIPFHLTGDRLGELEVVASHVRRELAYRDPADAWGYVASDTGAVSDGVRVSWRRDSGAHRVALGGEWRRDAVSDRSNLGVNLDGQAIVTTAGFVQDRIRLSERAGLQVGVRWDRADPWGSELSPRASLSWRGQGWRAWASWGHAFRAPSLGELYYPFSGNPGLRPERSDAAEAGLALAPRGGRAALQLVAFRSRERDLIDFDYARYRYGNIAAAVQRGIEGSATLRLAAATEVRLGATFLGSRDDGGEALLRRPQWSGSAVLSTAAGRASGELALVWVGPRVDLDPVTFARTNAAGFVTASLALRVPLRDWCAFRLRLENLADRSYAEVLGYPAPGRRACVGIETVIQ